MHQGGVPDILLSDLNMPGMSGFELLSEERTGHPDPDPDPDPDASSQ
jgi:CheY-like chemotaxis protein